MNLDRWRLYHWYFETFQRMLAGSIEKEDVALMRELIRKAMQAEEPMDKQFQQKVKLALSKEYHRSSFSIAFNNTKRQVMKELGKTPSRAVLLHQKIYEQHPDVGAILLAHPVHAMAFAVTDAAFDARTIPESYILLRDVKTLPYEEIYREPDKMAEEFDVSHPVAIVENDCVIVTGNSLLQAFDRLEVMELTANSILDSQSLGSIVHISDSEIAELKIAFHLED